MKTRVAGVFLSWLGFVVFVAGRCLGRRRAQRRLVPLLALTQCRDLREAKRDCRGGSQVVQCLEDSGVSLDDSMVYVETVGSCSARCFKEKRSIDLIFVRG